VGPWSISLSVASQIFHLPFSIWQQRIEQCSAMLSKQRIQMRRSRPTTYIDDGFVTLDSAKHCFPNSEARLVTIFCSMLLYSSSYTYYLIKAFHSRYRFYFSCSKINLFYRILHCHEPKRRKWGRSGISRTDSSS
jgi:hypothetical protein